MVEQQLPKLAKSPEILPLLSKTPRVTSVSFQRLGNRAQNKMAPPDGNPTRPHRAIGAPDA